MANRLLIRQTMSCLASGRGPLPDRGVYGNKESQLNRLTEGHEQVAQALLAATPD